MVKYFITATQIEMLKAFNPDDECKDLLEDIEENQYLGEFEDEKD